jgi:8-oxo-dGTP diphosphatase
MSKPVTPLLTVDCVAFDDRSRVLLIKRKHPPFKGLHALPGGFVDIGETVEAACRREMKEETGVIIDKLFLVGVYSEPGRDPRGHTVSVTYATALERVTPIAGDDASEAEWQSDWRNIELAFDHTDILRQAYKFMRRRRLIPPLN